MNLASGSQIEAAFEHNERDREIIMNTFADKQQMLENKKEAEERARRLNTLKAGGKSKIWHHEPIRFTKHLKDIFHGLA